MSAGVSCPTLSPRRRLDITRLGRASGPEGMEGFQMKLRLLAGAALSGMFVAGGAFAEPAPSGWYGAIDAGGHFPQPLQTTSDVNEDASGPFRFRIGQKDDWTAFLRVGYKISPHLRVELEGGYRPSRISSITDNPSRAVGAICGFGSTPTICLSTNGHSDVASVMANVLYDFIPNGVVDPYVGGGIGGATDSMRFSGAASPFAVPNPTIVNVHSESTEFAYQ